MLIILMMMMINGRSGATWRSSLCSSPLLVTSLSFEVTIDLFIFNARLIILLKVFMKVFNGWIKRQQFDDRPRPGWVGADGGAPGDRLEEEER